MSQSGPIDWAAAGAIGGRITRPGPVLSPNELADLVGSLRAAATRAVEPVAQASALATLLDESAAVASVHVVDRARCVHANAESMSVLARPLVESSLAQGVTAVGEAAATAEVAGLLALLSARVLGQFDPYGVQAPGRLLLVAPNVLAVQESLGADPADFHLWVCLHELTHAAQFQAAPWLVDHIIGLLHSMSGETDLADDTSLDGATPGFVDEIADAAASIAAAGVRVGRLVRAGYRTARGVPGASLTDAVLNPEQRTTLADLTAVMALLEGHADVTMDAVGPGLIPTVAQLRDSFDQRRGSATGMAKVLSRLLGMEDKLAQYRDGAAFVRAVRDQGGESALVAAWTSAENLPRPGEIADPRAWLRRVHG